LVTPSFRAISSSEVFSKPFSRNSLAPARNTASRFSSRALAITCDFRVQGDAAILAIGWFPHFDKLT